MRLPAVLAAVLAVATWAALCAGCPRKGGDGTVEPPSDPYPGREQSVRGLLLRDLEIEVLDGYDLPTFETAVPATAVSSRVGAVHIGVGPGDITAGKVGSIDRWPLLPVDDIGERLDVAESKRLELHLSRDFSVAWTFDEISYRIPGCLGRDGAYKQVVIPLRMTQVYVRDGERWVPVLEHLSYPQRTAALVDRVGGLLGKKMRNGRDPRPEVDAPLQAIVHALDPAITQAQRDAAFSSADDALAMWPDPNDELRRSAVVNGASLAAVYDATKVTVESWRIGMSPDPTGGVGGGSVAWMAATLRVDGRRAHGDAVEAAPLRLRATFVLEQRDGHWEIVQSHVSSPIEDDALLAAVLGSAASGDTPAWQRPCDGAWTAPAPKKP
jgi:ketosteroid isomerase-like protein